MKYNFGKAKLELDESTFVNELTSKAFPFPVSPFRLKHKSLSLPIEYDGRDNNFFLLSFAYNCEKGSWAKAMRSYGFVPVYVNCIGHLSTTFKPVKYKLISITSDEFEITYKSNTFRLYVDHVMHYLCPDNTELSYKVLSNLLTCVFHEKFGKYKVNYINQNFVYFGSQKNLSPLGCAKWRHRDERIVNPVPTVKQENMAIICDSLGAAGKAFADNHADPGKWNIHYIKSFHEAFYASFEPGTDIAFLLDNHPVFPISFESLAHKINQLKPNLVFDVMRFNGVSSTMLKKMQQCGYHGSKALSLELNRYLGKKYATKIGMNVAPYFVINKDNVHKLPEFLMLIKGDTVVAKLNTGQFLGFYSRQQLAKVIEPWILDQEVIVEQYIPTTNEVNYCFLISKSKVTPVATLYEKSRLTDNEMGGKVGTAYSIHATPYAHTIPKKVIGQINKLLKDVDDFCGWVDVSFMIYKGRLYFTEWMVRNACSNFITLLSQMENRYLDIMEDLKLDRKIEIRWKSKYSIGVEIYNLPFLLPVIEGEQLNITHEAVNLQHPNMRFDFLEQALLNQIGDTAYLTPSTRRIGVLSYLTDKIKIFDPLENKIEIVKDDYAIIANQLRHISGLLSSAIYRLPPKG